MLRNLTDSTEVAEMPADLQNYVFVPKVDFMLKPQPGLSGNPFLLLEMLRQKRLGTEDGNSCPNIIYQTDLDAIF